MIWQYLTSAADLEKAVEDSQAHKVLILKHSTRCGISSTVLDRLERKWNDEEMIGIKPYYLNLIKHRDVSNLIADRFGVRHESPQVLVIDKGECTYHESHFQIDYLQIKTLV